MPMLISWAEVAAIAICVVASRETLEARCNVIDTVNDKTGSVCIVGAGDEGGSADPYGVGEGADEGFNEGRDDGAPDGCVDGSALGGTVATE